MNEESFCPYCDELVDLSFTDDYWETEQGEEIVQVDCPNCQKPISVSWEVSHSFNFNKGSVSGDEEEAQR